jgi:hypothetical protein
VNISVDKVDILNSRVNNLAVAVVVVKVEVVAGDLIVSERTDAKVTHEFAVVAKVICAAVDAIDLPNHVKKKVPVWQEERKLHYPEVVADVDVVGDDDDAAVVAVACNDCFVDGNESLHPEAFDETDCKD